MKTEIVALADLTLVQEEVSVQALLDLYEGVHEPFAPDEYPHVIRWSGNLYVEDGHHRLLFSWLRGDQYATVRLFEV